MSYVLEGGLHGHGMDELSELHLSHTPISFSEVTGKGKDKSLRLRAVAEATNIPPRMPMSPCGWRGLEAKLQKQQARRL